MQTGQVRPINETYCINDSVLLGKGSTGNVYLGFERNKPLNRVAIKVIDLKTIDNEVTRYLLSCEIAALSNLGKILNTGHENIVKLHDIVLQDQFIFLVMEHLQGGTLAQYIKRHPQGLNENEALYIFRQILEGYAHMRNKQIVHRDLKPDNILFKNDPQRCKKVAIIDFGYCQMEEVPNKPQLYYNVGSPKYMSPEAYRQNHYSQKSDIWALGVIFYEMLVGKTCDHGLSMQNYLQMIEKQGIPLPAHITPFNRHILCIMLSYLHGNRLTAEQILREIDGYINGLNHQRSEVILRNNMDNRFPQQNINGRNNKNNAVFQSLILSSNNQGGRRSFNENDANAWDKNKYVFQRKDIPFGTNMPVIQINSKPMIEFNRQVPQQNIRRVQNARLGSVRQIVHRKVVVNEEKTIIQQPVELKSSFINNNQMTFVKTQQFNQTATKFIQISHSNLNATPQVDQKIQFASMQAQQTQNTPIIHHNSLIPRVQFTNNFPQNQRPISPIPNTQFHPIVAPFSNGIKIKINTNNPVPILNIQQQKKIELDSLRQSQKYHSPQKQPITVASNIQFFTDKKNNMPEANPSPPKQQRPIINLRPPISNGEIKVGFTKLQPQKILRFNQFQNQVQLLKQEFCA